MISDESEGEGTSAPKSSQDRKPSTSKKAKPTHGAADEDDRAFSGNEVSQKGYLNEKAKSGFSKQQAVTKPDKQKFKTITKNYCPDDAPDNQHKYYFRANIGTGFTVSLAKWFKNNQKYIQIRKATTGANIPISQYKYLKKAILDLERLCPKALMKNEVPSDDSD